MLPFVFFAGVYILAYPYLAYILCYALSIEKRLKAAGTGSAAASPEPTEVETIGAWTLFSKVRFFFVAMSQMLLMLSL